MIGASRGPDHRPLHGFGPLVSALDQHGELVAAESGNESELTDAVSKPSGDAMKNAIADHVAESVVDRLESVEVDIHDRDFGRLAVGGLQSLLERRAKVRTVGEPREIVVARAPLELAGLAIAQERVTNDPLQNRRPKDVVFEHDIGPAVAEHLDVHTALGLTGDNDDRNVERPRARMANKVQARCTIEVILNKSDVVSSTANRFQPFRESPEATNLVVEQVRSANGIGEEFSIGGFTVDDREANKLIEPEFLNEVLCTIDNEIRRTRFSGHRSDHRRPSQSLETDRLIVIQRAARGGTTR